MQYSLLAIIDTISFEKQLSEHRYFIELSVLISTFIFFEPHKEIWLPH